MLSFLSPVPTLPRYSGSYDVGSTEYEIPTQQIDQHSSPPDSQITTIKFRLFYPTDSKSSKSTTTWVPPPQRQWIEAFANFLGTGSLSWVKPLLSVMSYITIPALANVPLLKPTPEKRYPLVIFSHGLAGNCNTYSSLCGSLASCGVVCAAIEHRDGSAPTSSIRGSDGTVVAQVGYKKYAHTPSTEVINSRSAQLRIRLWELDLLYSALGKLDQGIELSNYSVEKDGHFPTFQHSLDFTPSHVSWVGHSFGAATITQFIKSIYYHRSLPSLEGTPYQSDPGWQPLYKPASNSKLLEQITPSSPIALLDVWTLIFVAPNTQWLWEKPMPCYDGTHQHSSPSTISIMSTEFYNWTDLKNRTNALLSLDPVQRCRQLSLQSRYTTPASTAPTSPIISTPPNKADNSASTQMFDLPPATLPIDDNDELAPEPPSEETSSTPSPAPSSDASSESSIASSSTSISAAPTPEPSKATPAKLFYIPSTAHLSQSDFGVLFPTLTRWLMKAIDPEGTIKLNVRAITAAMRNSGLDAQRPVEKSNSWFDWGRREEDGDGDGEVHDNILDGGEVWSDGRREKRWVELPLTGDE